MVIRSSALLAASAHAASSYITKTRVKLLMGMNRSIKPCWPNWPAISERTGGEAKRRRGMLVTISVLVLTMSREEMAGARDADIAVGQGVADGMGVFGIEPGILDRR